MTSCMQQTPRWHCEQLEEEKKAIPHHQSAQASLQHKHCQSDRSQPISAPRLSVGFPTPWEQPMSTLIPIRQLPLSVLDRDRFAACRWEQSGDTAHKARSCLCRTVAWCICAMQATPACMSRTARTYTRHTSARARKSSRARRFP